MFILILLLSLFCPQNWLNNIESKVLTVVVTNSSIFWNTTLATCFLPVPWLAYSSNLMTSADFKRTARCYVPEYRILPRLTHVPKLRPLGIVWRFAYEVNLSNS